MLTIVWLWNTVFPVLCVVTCAEEPVTDNMAAGGRSLTAADWAAWSHQSLHWILPSEVLRHELGADLSGSSPGPSNDLNPPNRARAEQRSGTGDYKGKFENISITIDSVSVILALSTLQTSQYSSFKISLSKSWCRGLLFYSSLDFEETLQFDVKLLDSLLGQTCNLLTAR